MVQIESFKNAAINTVDTTVIITLFLKTPEEAKEVKTLIEAVHSLDILNKRLF